MGNYFLALMFFFGEITMGSSSWSHGFHQGGNVGSGLQVGYYKSGGLVMVNGEFSEISMLASGFGSCFRAYGRCLLLRSKVNIVK